MKPLRDDPKGGGSPPARGAKLHGAPSPAAAHSAKRSEAGPETSRELRQVRELAKILNQNELAEIEFENAGIRVRLRREVASASTVLAPATVIATPLTAPSPAPAKPAEGTAAPPAPHVEDGALITSPFVGTFYRSPSPDAQSFVDRGQRIKKGQVLCIVEAMKLMNEIESDVDGVILDILAENGQPVEYGEPLFRIGP
jgi:acetyl-CoA carboxylase biotin carboxyl carrier protein